ncbi:acyltransferase family protein [Vibrio cyclitrophicus]
MNFRYDINGLRAVAVIAVVLFHFNPDWVPGGFAGVDVFFVISGFLMTSIIFRGLDNNNLNLFKFYVARANRIIPALAMLCVSLLVLGWFYLTPMDYKALGKHAASSMGFLSNFIYWRESGYFDADSHEKWLLHTWSLSVEWQFYIIYPLLLKILAKFLSINNIKRLLLIGTLLAFIFSVAVTFMWPNPAYYLLPTRAWEMMFGGLAFLYPWNLSDRRKKIAEFLGLAMILFSYFFASSSVPWPGYFALLPVLGAYMLISANRQSSIITNNTLFQYVGRWSYSIYLWHWPIIVFGYNFNIENWHLYGLPLSIIFGFMSYRFIERFSFKVFERWFDIFKVKAFLMSLFISFISLFVFANPQFHLLFRYPDSPNLTFFYNALSLSKQDTQNYTWKYILSIEGNTNIDDGILILGDSQAGDFSNILHELNLPNQYSISSSIVSTKCGIGFLSPSKIERWRTLSTDIYDNFNLEKTCVEQWQLVKSNIEKNKSAKVLYYVMNWKEYSFELMEDSISSIKKIIPNTKIVVVGRKGSLNLLEADPYVDLETEFLLTIEQDTSILHKSSILASFGDDHINIYDKICNDGKCEVSYKGWPILYDDCHSTKAGVDFLVDKLREDIFRTIE